MGYPQMLVIYESPTLVISRASPGWVPQQSLCVNDASTGDSPGAWVLALGHHWDPHRIRSPSLDPWCLPMLRLQYYVEVHIACKIGFLYYILTCIGWNPSLPKAEIRLVKKLSSSCLCYHLCCLHSSQHLTK